MSVTLHWDDESCSTLRVDFAGRWTLAEVRAAFTEMNQLLGGAAETPMLVLNHVGSYVPPRFGADLVESDVFPLPASGLPALVVFVGNLLAFELYEAQRRPLAVQGRLPIVWVRTLEAARDWVARVKAGEALPFQVGQPAMAN